MCTRLTSCGFNHDTTNALHDTLHEPLGTLLLRTFHWLHEETRDAVIQPVSKALGATTSARETAQIQ